MNQWFVHNLNNRLVIIIELFRSSFISKQSAPYLLHITWIKTGVWWRNKYNYRCLQPSLSKPSLFIIVNMWVWTFSNVEQRQFVEETAEWNRYKMLFVCTVSTPENKTSRFSRKSVAYATDLRVNLEDLFSGTCFGIGLGGWGNDLSLRYVRHHQESRRTESDTHDDQQQKRTSRQSET